MIPPHQGIVLSALTGSSVPVIVIRDAPHNPMHHNKGRDCATGIRTAFGHASWPSTPLPPPVHDASDSASDRINRLERLNKNYRCSFSKTTTQCEVEDMYDELLGICANAASATTTDTDVIVASNDAAITTTTAAISTYRTYSTAVCNGEHGEDSMSTCLPVPVPVNGIPLDRNRRSHRRLKHPRVYLVEGNDVTEMLRTAVSSSSTHNRSTPLTDSQSRSRSRSRTELLHGIADRNDNQTVVRNFLLPAMEKYFR
jgi:hypothetical protein